MEALIKLIDCVKEKEVMDCSLEIMEHGLWERCCNILFLTYGLFSRNCGTWIENSVSINIELLLIPLI
jgi:hypothetical protein